MDGAAYQLAKNGETNEPLLVNVLIARRINSVLGGAFVAPWEVQELPEDITSAILSLEHVNDYREGLNQVESVFAKWRTQHVGK